MTIADNGVGFDPTVARKLTAYGLSGLAERAALIGAHLDISSQPDEGTSVTVKIPAGST